jgi:hypothetical protein
MAMRYFWAHLSDVARQFAAVAFSDSAPAETLKLDPDRATQGSMPWLTPHSLEGYDPRDFEFLEPPQQRELQANVEVFQSVARQVGGKSPPSQERRRAAAVALIEILKLLKPHQFHDPEAFRIQVLLERELRDKLPSWVAGFHCETGTDVGDDEAVYIWLNLTKEGAEEKAGSREGMEVCEVVESAVRRLGILRWPYVWFRETPTLAAGPRRQRR